MSKVAVFNLWHLKRANGMYYYGKDYVERASGNWSVVVRKDFPLSVLGPKLLPQVKIVGALGYAWIVLRHCLAGSYIFCPSPHPLPFISRQLVVLHDSFPFKTDIGRVKKFLFSLSLKSSGCSVGFINKTDSLCFLEALGVKRSRLIYMPNFVPSAMRSISGVPAPPRRGPVRIGLIGTDSGKKNYESLFEAVKNTAREKDVEFCAYGHHTPYFSSLVRKFSDLKIGLVESDLVGLDAFFDEVDVIASVSRGEGFCRPAASALAAGIPCYLLDDPVFLEFYQGVANISNSVTVLLETLLKDFSAGMPMWMGKAGYFPPRALVEAFDAGVKNLSDMGR